MGLLMRRRFGVGKPRCAQGRAAALWAAFVAMVDTLLTLMRLPAIATDDLLPQWSSLPHPANELATA